MLRLFATHEIRKQEELSDCLWEFATMPDKGDPVVGKAVVPGCWENRPGTLTYRGKACYEKEFEAGGNLRLEFKGVSHTADVFVDGQQAAHHYNAYTPFSAIVRGLPEGRHRLKVVVDNSFCEESALHIPNDYQSYGGITRGVALERLGALYIEWLHVTPLFREGCWYAGAEVKVRNLEEEDFSGKVSLKLEGQTIAEVPIEIAGGADRIVTAGEIPCPGVSPWRPESPVLYRLFARILDQDGIPVDDLIDRIGFREVKVEGREILLNGSPLQIRGFCRHEEHPQFGCALPLAAMQQDLLLMRDMGANSVRTSHYPNDEIFLDLCDETGFLVWEENHARGLSEEAMRNPHFERQCEDCIREMIEAHYNHPSIYIWGILNECASHTEYGRECYEKQLSLIRKLDGSRPCSYASCQFKTDICFDLPDVVSYNIYPLWYHETPPEEYLADLYDWVQKETGGAGKPFLITEVGAGGIYSYRRPDKVKWSEERQAEILEEQLKAISGHKAVNGVYVWQFCDGNVSESWFGGRPRTMNNKGIVDEYRRPKLAYETVKRMFREERDI
ncbi:MAG: hypothetical protein NC123_17790 [Butyrivibrio sp.]|nr:hypothetical protein [Acetatifactor muris]MCM1561366.1 hypothetical protein [Butyrivibrio sp.]